MKEEDFVKQLNKSQEDKLYLCEGLAALELLGVPEKADLCQTPEDEARAYEEELDQLLASPIEELITKAKKLSVIEE